MIMRRSILISSEKRPVISYSDKLCHRGSQENGCDGARYLSMSMGQPGLLFLIYYGCALRMELHSVSIRGEVTFTCFTVYDIAERREGYECYCESQSSTTSGNL